jgi:hypothetical protein
MALRCSVLALLSLLGVAGLAQWRLLPPPAMRTGASTDRVLADLAAQEALQDGRARATEALGQFVGGQITRYFWGSFTGYLDVLGLETPEGMESRIREAPDQVQLMLIPRACSGRGEPAAFRYERDALHCPPGWTALELPARRSAGQRS